MKTIIITLALLLGCYNVTNAGNKTKRVNQLIEQTAQELIPDKRLEVYEISASKENGKIVLSGKTTHRGAHEALLKNLRSENLAFSDQIILLPDTSEHKKCYGVVNLSVMNMRNKASYSAEMVSQATLGMPVRILEEGNWRRVSTPDNYIGWITAGSVQPMTRDEFNQWNEAPKVVFLPLYGTSHTLPDPASTPVSDLVSGAMLVWEGEYEGYHRVVYPDGRRAYIRKSEAISMEHWLKSRHQDPSFFITTARRMLGIPYLWGGTSPKGMDCSGFIKSVAFQNGLILSRDASQQAYEGQRVEINGNFNLLLPGDLLFFGKKEENSVRVIHVGMYLGDKQFIHSATSVKIASFDPESELYDEYNTNRFLWATRIYDDIGSPGLIPIQDNPYYQNQ